MKTRYTLLFILSLLVCIVLPAVLLSNPTSATGGQLRDIQGIRDKVLVLESGFDWLKFLGQSIFAFLALFAGFVFFLFTRIDSRIDKMEANTSQDIQRLESNTRQDMQKLESRIDRIDSKLDLLIQSQASQQDTKQSPAKRQAKR